jgi:hypothetical protein
MAKPSLMRTECLPFFPLLKTAISTSTLVVIGHNDSSLTIHVTHPILILRFDADEMVRLLWQRVGLVERVEFGLFLFGFPLDHPIPPQRE